MTMEYEITAHDDYIRIDCQGRTSYTIARKMLTELADKASWLEHKKLLFDLRGAAYDHAYADTINHAQEVESLGFGDGFRTALLGDEKDRSMLQYIEDVAVNRGFKVKAFVDEPQAVEWLRGSG